MFCFSGPPWPSGSQTPFAPEGPFRTSAACAWPAVGARPNQRGRLSTRDTLDYERWLQIARDLSTNHKRREKKKRPDGGEPPIPPPIPPPTSPIPIPPPPPRSQAAPTTTATNNIHHRAARRPPPPPPRSQAVPTTTTTKLHGLHHHHHHHCQSGGGAGPQHQCRQIIAKCGLVERVCWRATSLSQEKERELMLDGWQWFDWYIQLAACGSVSDLEHYVANPHKWAARRGEIDIVMSDHIPVWLRAGPGKVCVGAAALQADRDWDRERKRLRTSGGDGPDARPRTTRPGPGAAQRWRTTLIARQAISNWSRGFIQ